MRASARPDLAAIEARASREALTVLGGSVESDGTATTLLLGPDEPSGFWAVFSASDEARDQAPDPLDRWSERVIGGIASELGAEALFPFGGPPFHPFYTWALKTGRIHESPVRLLVHDRAGLWVSFRGALRFPGRIALPDPPPSPCTDCPGRPCLDACPVHALTGEGYDVAQCKAHVSAPEGESCRSGGCRVRAVCPASKRWARVKAQSAFHMAAFVPR